MSCAPLLALAGCPSQPSSTVVAGETNPCADSPRPMSFSIGTFRAPSRELRELDAAGCLAPSSGHGVAAAIERVHTALAGDVTPPEDDPPIGKVPEPPLLDWNWPTPTPTAPVTGTPAVYIRSFPSQDNTNDKLFYGTNTTRGPNFYALNNLYSAAPTQVWSASNGGMDGGGVVLDQSGDRVFMVDSFGDLYCYKASSPGTTASQCNGWAQPKYTTGNGASLTTPWYDYVSGDVFFGDLAGKVYKVDGGTGNLIWSVDTNTKMTAPCTTGACSSFGVRSSVVQINNTVFVGNDAGALFRIIDPGLTTPVTVSSSWLCTSPTAPLGCGSAWGVLNGVTVDNVTNTVYAAADGVMFEYPLSSASSWTSSFKVDLGTAAGYPVYSSPIVDYTNTYVYVGYYNKLFKIKYPFSGASVATSGLLAGAGADGSYPHSSPLPYSGSMYIGDGSGSADQFGCLSSASAPALTATTINYGDSVDSAPVIDFGTGNINFGYSSGTGTTGGVVQITQSSLGACGTGSTCSNAGCGGTGSACIAVGQCCSGTPAVGCGSNPTNGTVACNAANNCATTCSGGFKLCGTACIANASCCSDSDCSGGTPVCSGVGGTCVAGQNISFVFHPPANSGTQSVVATISTPITTLTAASGVTFTNGNTRVNGVGTTFTTDFKVGQQISADGTNFYTITTVNNNTRVTLSAGYGQATKTVTSYYQADCVAGQLCPSSVNKTIACAGTTCTLATKLGAGDYAITAVAYDGASGTGQKQGAFVMPSKFRLTGGGNDLTSVDLVLPRVFPVGLTSTDARCPLDLTIDSSGNVWTVNGNGNSGSNCSGPTNNLTKLVKGTGAYAPTVVNNPAISASPEFIDADGAGNVWTTVPSLTAGIFKLTSTGTVASGFPVGSGQCQTPRGVAVDTTTAGANAAYVACYGTTTFPGGGGRKVQKWASGGGSGTPAISYDLTDSANQPVSVVVPFSTGQDLTGDDYNCRTNVYVNRSSTTSVVISRLPLLLNAVVSYSQSTSSDLNPYGLTFDGGGTPYTVARTTGDIINVEYTGSGIQLDSDNANRGAPTPWGIATDDQYSTNVGTCHPTISTSDIWVSHASAVTGATSNNIQVSRFNNNPQTAKNNYITGSTTNPQPRAIKFDASTGYFWVVNSAEATLSRISKRLALFAGDTTNASPTTCSTSTAVGGTITVSGKGFDSTPANNTVLIGGYLANVTAVTINATGTQDTMTVKVPTDVAGVVKPITLVNADGAVQSLCNYTTQ